MTGHDYTINFILIPVPLRPSLILVTPRVANYLRRTPYMAGAYFIIGYLPDVGYGDVQHTDLYNTSPRHPCPSLDGSLAVILDHFRAGQPCALWVE